MCTLESWLNTLIQNGSITYDDAVIRTLYPKEIRPAVPVPAGVGSNAR
jgi:twitching motility protein PilT